MTPTNGNQATQFSRQLFHEANDAFLIVDPSDLRILDVNATAQRLTGWRRKSLLATRLDELLEGDDATSIRNLLDACHSTQFFHSVEGYALKRSEGPSLAVNVSVSRIHGEDSTLGLVVVRDVTDRKRAEESLRQTNERLQAALNTLQRQQEIVVQQDRMQELVELARRATHELNNLLTPIVGYAELLLSRRDLAPEVREQLTNIASAANDAAEVVRDLQLAQHPRRERPKPVSNAGDAGLQATAGELRILYIDDDTAARGALSALLRALGFRVDLAEDGDAGIAMFHSGEYDVVLTDLDMPGTNGREVTRVIKQARPEMPVILISGWGETLVCNDLDEQSRPDFVLSKPTRIGELAKTLQLIRSQLKR